MNCTEFQRVLPYIIEGGGNAEEQAHLASCAVCSDLVNDLKYIAEQAKLLVPMEDPGPGVWDGIQRSLAQERLIRNAAPRGRLLGGWMPVAGLAAAVAIILFAAVTLSRVLQTPTAPPVAESQARATDISDDDQRVLSLLGGRDAAVRQSYEKNLREVNAYISDARRSLQEDPGNDAARDHLMQAYDEKAMLYEMAMTQNGQ